MTGGQNELSHRQRKHVYMHSTIFDKDGPSTKSVYAPSRQAELHTDIDTRKRHNNHTIPDLDMPSAADVRITHNAGHNVVHPSGGGGYPSNRDPRTTTSSHIVADGEAMPVIHAGGKDGAIPKEFWNTSVNLQWHDVRNETNTCRHPRVHGERSHMDNKGLKMQELSSEVFGSERRTDRSTACPRRELLADSTDHMRVDSGLDSRSQPSHVPLAESHAYGDHKQQPKHAHHRFADNLSHSNGNTIGGEDGEIQSRATTGPRMLDENPDNVDRRRKEKNFSDLFGANHGEYKGVQKQREEVTSTKMCSFLDARAEIATRNTGKWKTDPTQHAASRKEAERNSSLFDRECPAKPEMEPAHREVHGHERSCWDTTDLLQSGSEIARRRRHPSTWHDHDNHTALQRKHEDLASTQVRVGLNQGQHVEAANPGFRQQFGRMDSATSAKDTKLASLQSSIFS